MRRHLPLPFFDDTNGVVSALSEFKKRRIDEGACVQFPSTTAGTPKNFVVVKIHRPCNMTN